jgi:hyperosmotically inducible periplasmic protein
VEKNMLDTFRRLSLAALLAAVGLLAAGCDQRHDATAGARPPRAIAGVVSNGDVQAAGTDEAVEDSELTTKVREAIRADPQLQSQEIDVDAKDSAVTLTGIVDSPPLRERAIELASTIHGVVQVQDDLKVRS